MRECPEFDTRRIIFVHEMMREGGYEISKPLDLKYDDFLADVNHH